MLRRISYIFAFLIIFILLLNFSPGIHSAVSLFDAHRDMMDMSQKKVIAQTGEYSVPRNQVLLEIATGTW